MAGFSAPKDSAVEGGKVCFGAYPLLLCIVSVLGCGGGGGSDVVTGEVKFPDAGSWDFWGEGGLGKDDTVSDARVVLDGAGLQDGVTGDQGSVDQGSVDAWELVTVDLQELADLGHGDQWGQDQVADAGDGLDGAWDLGDLVGPGDQAEEVDVDWPDSGEEDLSAQEPYVTIKTDNNKGVVGKAISFYGSSNCVPGKLTFTADELYVLGSKQVSTSSYDYQYVFNTPGIERTISVKVVGESGCEATSEVKITIQGAFLVDSQSKTDSNGNGFTVRRVRFPTADLEHDLVVTGSGSAKTVQNMALPVVGARGAVNGGYFASGQGPVSYAKGQLGYESPSGNVKGPRGCLWYDKEERTAGIGVSMGRNFLGGGTWGPGLFPEASDVVCAGPILVSGGQNVFWQQYELEDFGTSGISPSSPLPRSAICILDDGSIMVLAAQNDTVKARGFTLPELADYMISQGCVEALNLDGGGSSAFWASSPGAGYWPGTEDRAVYTAVVCK